MFIITILCWVLLLVGTFPSKHSNNSCSFFFSPSSKYFTSSSSSSSFCAKSSSSFSSSSTKSIFASAQSTAATQLWSMTVSDEILTPPVVSDKHQVVLFGTGLNDGQMRAVNIFSGEVKWTYFPGAYSRIQSSPVIFNESLVIFGSSNQKLVALDITTGLPVWQKFLGSGIYADPFIEKDTLFIGSDDKIFYAMNASSGVNFWTFTTAAQIRGSPVVTNDGARVIFGCTDGKIFALNAATGSQIWVYTANAAPRAPMMVTSTGYVSFGTDDGDVYGIFVSSGLLRFRYKSGTGAVYATPEEFDNKLYLGLSDGALHTIENNNGVFQWKYQAVSGGGAGSIGSAVVRRGYCFFASSDGKIRAINATSGILDDPRFSWAIRESKDTPVFPSSKPVYVGNSIVIGIAGPSIAAVSDPTVVTTTQPPVTPEGGLPTTTTTTTTRSPYATFVQNPADILLATSVPSAVVALILFPLLAFLEF